MRGEAEAANCLEPSVKMETIWDHNWEELCEARADIYPGFGKRKTNKQTKNKKH